ncbi:unnamed protein product, partial [Rotaria sordida]
CKRLISLNFCSSCRYRLMAIHIFKPSTTNCISSTLTTLNINVDNFADCLYLLDGRLNCLSTLIIRVLKISPVISNIKNTKKLSELKSFSLTSSDLTMAYDNLIIPLLHRMINLEELKLLLSVIRFDSTYIDGIQLQDEVLIYIPRLNKLTFSIVTLLFNNNIKIDLRSNEEIQRSFIGRVYGQIGSDVQTLIMKNEVMAHMDYVEEFLFDKNIHLPRLLNLSIKYESLAIVTNNFTNDAARITCSKLKCLDISEPFVRPENFHQYFPLL